MSPSYLKADKKEEPRAFDGFQAVHNMVLRHLMHYLTSRRAREESLIYIRDSPLLSYLETSKASHISSHRL